VVPSSIPKSTENVMAESIYAATPEQVRRAAEYNEKESQRLLNSLMAANSTAGGGGAGKGKKNKKLGKKEMQQITSKAYAHANEAKRLARKAEMMDAEVLLAEEEREYDEMLRRKNEAGLLDGYGCSAMPNSAPAKTGGRDQPGDQYGEDRNDPNDDFNLNLCGAFGGGADDVPPPAPASVDRPRSPFSFANTKKGGGSAIYGGSHHHRAAGVSADNSINDPPTSIRMRPSSPANAPSIRTRPSSPGNAPSIRTRPSSPNPSSILRPSSPLGLNSVGSGAVASRAMSSVKLNPTIPSYDIMETRDGPDEEDEELKSPQERRGSLGVLGFFRGRSKSKDPPKDRAIDHVLSLSRSKSRDSVPLRNPIIANGIHNVEDEVNDILNHEEPPPVEESGQDLGADAPDDDSYEYAVAPSSMKVISKMDVTRPPRETRVKKPRENVIMNLSDMLAEADKHNGSNGVFGGHGSKHHHDSSNFSTTVTLKPIEMKKRTGSFRKTLSRLAMGKKRSSKDKSNVNRNIGLVSCDSEDEPQINEYVDYCISEKEKEEKDVPPDAARRVRGGSVFTAPPAKAGKDSGPIMFNKNELLSKILEDSAGSTAGASKDRDDSGLKLGASIDEGAGRTGLEASTSFQDMVNEMKGEQEDMVEVMNKINALEWRDPALGALEKSEDLSLPPMRTRGAGLSSPSLNGDSVAASSFGINPKYAQIEIGSFVMNDTKLENIDEVARIVKSGAVKKPKAKPTALERQRSRKDTSHDDHDAPALKISDSFNELVGRRRSDLIEQRREYELSQMEAFLNAYGEDAYKQVYGPYEEQLGYGLFYKKKDEEPDTLHQEDPIDTSIHSEAIMSQRETRLEDIHEDKPSPRRGRSMVRSAARKMKRSLSRKRSKSKQNQTSSSGLKTSQPQPLEQPVEGTQSQPFNGQVKAPLSPSSQQAEYQDIKTMPSRASRASRASSKEKSMASRANSSKGAESSTKQGSNARSDDAHFPFAPQSTDVTQSAEDIVGPATSPVSSTQYQAQQMHQGMPQTYSGQYQQSHLDQAVRSSSGDDVGAVYGMAQKATPAPHAQVPNLRSSAPPMVTENQLRRQQSSNRNNRNSVDCLLRRMRSESTEEEAETSFDAFS